MCLSQRCVATRVSWRGVEVRGFWDLERSGVRLERYVEARECVRGEAIGSVAWRCVVLGSGKRWG
jgi:hypothetical protein